MTNLSQALEGSYGHLLSAAIDAVRAASGVCRSVQSELVDDDTFTKKDRSPVTVADYSAQAVVSRLLRQKFPTIPMVGEESAATLRAASGTTLREQVVRHTRAVFEQRGQAVDDDEILAAIDDCNDPGGPSGQRWVLDPIDGTKGYLRRQQYAVALALLDDGVPVLGVLGCPSLATAAGTVGTLFCARRGRGAFQASLDESVVSAESIAPIVDQAERVQVSTVEEPADAVLCESVEAAHSSHDRHAAIANYLGVTKQPFRIDSQCKYGAVARGDASVYLRLPTSASYREKIWDHAAGWAVVSEAGGRVTDIHGKRVDFSLGRTLDRNRGMVVTNDALHDAVISAIAATADAASGEA